MRAEIYISSKVVGNKSSLIQRSDFLLPAPALFSALVRWCSLPLL